MEEQEPLELPIDEMVVTIRSDGSSVWALEVPEGLKRMAVDAVPVLEEMTGATILVSADPCFGACDLSGPELKRFGVEAVLHIGHLPLGDFRSIGMKYHFLPLGIVMDYHSRAQEALSDIETKFSQLGMRRVGLITTAQHTMALPPIRDVLSKAGFEVVIGKGGPRIFMDGQVLGCEFSSATSVAPAVDGYLFIGTGVFHPIGVSMTAKKPVATFDPYTKAVGDVEEDKDKAIRVRYGAVAQAKDAVKFGVVGSTRPGQVRKELSFQVKKRLEENGRKAVIMAGKHISPEVLDHMGFEALVITACPRIAVDDQARYKVPLLTPADLDMLLDGKNPEEYVFDSFENSEF